MIYVDTSVALAQMLASDRRPPASLWHEPLVSSRLLEYELWSCLHARDLGASHGEAARLLIGRLAMVELSRPVLTRALHPFPTRVCAADALHLASADFLRRQGQAVTVASYDDQFLLAARSMGLAISNL